MGHQLPTLVAADFEGVFIPEIWIAVAEKTGIKELQLTTRDISDYDELMAMRLRVLNENGITIERIQRVIAEMDPLPGAADFLQWLRTQTRLIILTDSFYQFVEPFLPKFNYPTIFAHSLEVSSAGDVVNYHLRTHDGKRRCVQSFGDVGFRTLAIGDSYNDTKMLLAADDAALFNPPQNVIDDFPQLAITNDYVELRAHVEKFLAG